MTDNPTFESAVQPRQPIEVPHSQSDNDRYVTDITYTMNYKPEINPLLIDFSFLLAGIRAPAVNTACELGFGQGLSLNFHAAGSSIAWYGNDFNLKHVLFAEELARASGTNCLLSPQAFRTFCARTDLPDFDFICLHGIWSWIDDENRAIIVEFLQRKLKPGGVAYVSYNALPGMTDVMPIRKILSEHASLANPDKGDLTSKIENAITFVERFMQINPKLSSDFPNMVQRLNHIKKQPKQYLAHEYFNSDWKPAHFSDLKEVLEPAGLQFACSANLIDHFSDIYLNQDQIDFLNSIDDISMRESMKDSIINQQFRADYWVKDPQPLTPADKDAALKGIRVLLQKDIQNITLEFMTYMGTASLHETICDPILAILSDYSPHSLYDIHKAVKDQGITLHQVLRVIAILISKEDLALANSDEVIEQVRHTCERLNTYLLARGTIADDVNYMVSPLTGGGVLVPNVEQLYLVGRRRKLPDPVSWMKFAWDVNYSRIGGILVGEPGSTMPDDDFGDELREHVHQWAGEKLPILLALKIK